MRELSRNHKEEGEAVDSDFEEHDEVRGLTRGQRRSDEPVAAPEVKARLQNVLSVMRTVQRTRLDLQQFHWMTPSSTDHAAAAGAMAALDEQGDALVEVMLGELQGMAGGVMACASHPMASKESAVDVLQRACETLSLLEGAHLGAGARNARDDLLSSLQRSLYLMHKV